MNKRKNYLIKIMENWSNAVSGGNFARQTHGQATYDDCLVKILLEYLST
jgi:hypothetical protein